MVKFRSKKNLTVQSKIKNHFYTKNKLKVGFITKQ